MCRVAVVFSVDWVKLIPEMTIISKISKVILPNKFNNPIGEILCAGITNNMNMIDFRFLWIDYFIGKEECNFR